MNESVVKCGRLLFGKVAIVTGGAIGIGAEYVKALAAEGAKVVIADIRDASSIMEHVETTSGEGSAVGFKTDVSGERSVRDMVEQTMAMWGHIDILVNNAALYSTLPPTKCTEISVETWDRVQAINVRGSFLTVKHVAPVMIEQKAGKIINIGSGVAYKGLPDMLHYATSKGAIVTLTRALARE